MRRRGGLGILIALEAIVLAVILIVGVLTGGLSKLRGANVGQVTDTISSEERMHVMRGKNNGTDSISFCPLQHFKGNLQTVSSIINTI